MNIPRFSLALVILLVGASSLFTTPMGLTKSASKPLPRATPYLIINRFTVDPVWDGSPLVINPNDSVNMKQTTDGSMVLAYQNTSPMNNQGTLAVTSGGLPPTILVAPALANQPSVLINNWKGNNLSVTNISVPGTNTPIQIQAIGPGFPGIKPLALSTAATLNMSPGQTAQGNALARLMQLVFQLNTGQLGVFVVMGGPADPATGNNARMVAVNAAQEAGPNTNQPTVQPPPGYYATTTGNYYYFQFNWGSSTIFIANLSGSTAAPAQITLRAL